MSNKSSKKVFKECLWLAASFILTIVLSILLFGDRLLSEAVDMRLHDTFFVVSPLTVVLTLFFFLTFIIYFIKEFRGSFSHLLPNRILLSVGLTLIVALTIIIKSLSQFLIGNSSFHTAISLTEENSRPEHLLNAATNLLIHFFTGIQIIVLLMLLFFTYLWGKQKRLKVPAQQQPD